MRFWFRRSPAPAAVRAADEAVARASGDVRPPLPPTSAPEAFEAVWRGGVKRRVLIVAAGFALWTVVIFGRLVQLQVLDHPFYLDLAANQQQGVFTTPAGRGDIVDRSGAVLAYSVDSAQIQANPVEVKEDAETARKLCAALRDCRPGEAENITRRLAASGKYLEIRNSREVTPEQLAAVRAQKLRAVALVADTVRYYPNRDLAAHVLGYVGIENRGLGGVESRFENVISGRPGRVLVHRDARQRSLSTRVEAAPTAGATIELTIDRELQFIAEKALREGIERARAKAGVAVIMDPSTGAILALANFPTFNPNVFAQFSDEDRRNRAVQELYEPGSTFKIVTAAAALEERVMAPSDLIDCSPGYIKFPGRKPITEAKGHNYGVLSFEDVIVKSSNVGAVKAGLRVGAERMALYARRFGFGQAIAPDFAGESRGIVHPPTYLNDSELASMSMGYTVGVTPVQMAAAVSAIANGGVLYQPHVVGAMIRDGSRQAVEPKALRRVISPETAATMRTIMEGVVERGTAKAARLERYQVAGKTGTAAKIINGVYSQTDYNSSFVGFVPSRAPAFTILVVIDTPRVGQYGGTVAAPVFKAIAEAALQHVGVRPSLNPLPAIIVADGVNGVRAEPVRATTPPTIQYAGGRPVMPDVRGLGARDALRILTAAGLVSQLNGSGTVTSQWPLPGEPIESGGWAMLDLGRPRALTSAPPGARR